MLFVKVYVLGRSPTRCAVSESAILSSMALHEEVGMSEGKVGWDTRRFEVDSNVSIQYMKQKQHKRTHSTRFNSFLGSKQAG
jgi:hypothetical protein